MTDAVIQAHTRELKLPAVAREYTGLARQAAADGWRFEDYLKELLEAEIRSRRDHVATARIHEAHFPDIKTLDIPHLRIQILILEILPGTQNNIERYFFTIP